MDWQEAAVAVIVGTAVVSLYRHLHGIFAAPKRGGGAASCHGCGDECASEGSGRPTAPGRNAVPDPTVTIH